MTPRPADLRARILTAIAVLLLVAPITAPGPAAAFLGGVVALLAAARARPDWHRLLHLEAFLVLLLATLPFTLPGTPIARLGPLEASREGLTRALVLGLKLSGAGLLAGHFFGREEPERIGAALRALGCPEALVRIFLGLARYQGLLRAEARRLSEAMKLRGFRPGLGPRTWRAYGNLVGMLMLRALDRAERVSEAMRARGYAGRFPGAAARPLARADLAAGAALSLGAAALLLWDRL
ncbi:cobalt ECF transporter T component CbiQ [Rhodobacter xanthinilyticus]|uniref:Cobalt ECF transporter T component CbiQ n=1 Tax=Rhodobacter xanthinilyticus TaxID=1850250 RepID=A0A1D9MBY9_9RHOB|nr:energy-coupling factor transporter transmembrane component T [Rhodobacter xanthinilyticus]AOZ69320.1 cobalt ECF transporter T component CbiQ [Rhodobacter xanthinilyticus]